MKRRVLCLAALLAVTVLLVAGCTTTPKNFVLSLADAPSNAYEQVNIGIKQIEVRALDSGEWTVVADYSANPKMVNLLDLRINELVVAANLPNGIYEELRLVLDKKGSIVLAGDTTVYPLTVGESSEPEDPEEVADLDVDEQAIEIKYPFTVASGSVTSILIDFDLTKVIEADGMGGYVLNPDEVEAFDNDEVGAVEGQVVVPGAQLTAGTPVKVSLLDSTSAVVTSTLAIWEAEDDEENHAVAQPGKFKIRGVVAGQYSLLVEVDGYKPATISGLTFGNSTEIDFEDAACREGLVLSDATFDTEGHIVLQPIVLP